MDTNVRVPSLGLGGHLTTVLAFGTIAWQHLLHSWGSPGARLGSHLAHGRRDGALAWSLAALAMLVGRRLARRLGLAEGGAVWGGGRQEPATDRRDAMKIRMISGPILALVVGLAMLSPTPAVGQHTRLIFGDDQGIWVPATDQQIIRVTIGNPRLPAPAGDRQLQSFVIQFDRPVDPVTIGPGESFTYTLDPREVGLGPRPVRPVRVSFRVQTDVLEGQSDPRPALTIEVLNRRTAAVESFLAFPGFAGGVYVGAGDI